MTDDLMRQFHEFQRYVDRPQAMLAAAQAGLAHAVTGSDRSGTVTIALGRDGIPESARVEADWLRRLPSDRFADAVVEASRVAATSRLEQWARQLSDIVWRAERSVGPTHPRQRVATEATAAPILAEDRLSRRPQRSLNTLAEDVMTALRNMEQLAASRPPTALPRLGRHPRHRPASLPGPARRPASPVPPHGGYRDGTSGN